MRCCLTFWSFHAIRIDISVTSWQQHHQWYHCIPYVKKIEMRCKMTFVMWCHWHQHLDHMMPLALVSAICDVDSMIIGTIASLRLWWSKRGVIWLFGNMTPLGQTLESCDADSVVNDIIAFLIEGKMIKMRCNIFFFGNLHHWCWCWCQMMQTVLSMPIFHSLDQDDCNEVQHDFF